MKINLGQDQLSLDEIKEKVSTLPEEIVAHVFSFLNPADLAQSQQVCHHWNQIGGDNMIWRPFFNAELEMIGESKDEYWKKCYEKIVNEFSGIISIKDKYVKLIGVFKFYRACNHIISSCSEEVKSSFQKIENAQDFMEKLLEIIAKENNFDAQDRLVILQHYSKLNPQSPEESINILHFALLADYQTRIGNTDLITKLTHPDLLFGTDSLKATPIQYALSENLPTSIIDFLHEKMRENPELMNDKDLKYAIAIEAKPYFLQVEDSNPFEWDVEEKSSQMECNTEEQRSEKENFLLLKKKMRLLI